MENSAVTHSQNRHGDERQNDQLPITEEDYQLIPDILEHYDKLEKSDKKDRQGNDIIIYEKSYPDGTVVYLEEVRNKRKSLAFHTMYKKKKGTDSPDGLMHEASPITSETTPGNLDSGGKGSGFAPEKQGSGGKSPAPAAPAPSRDDLEASLGMAVMDLGDMELPEGLSRRHLDNISDDLRWAYVNAVHKAPMPKLGEGGPTAEQIEAEQYRIFLDEYEASAGRYAREKDEPYLRTAYEHFQRKLAEARARVSEKGFADPGKNGNFAESKKGGGYAGTDKEPEAGTHEGHETGDSLGGGERAGDEGAGGVRELRAEIRPGSELGGASQDRQVSGGAPRRENLGTGKDAVGIVGASGGERRTGLGERGFDKIF